MVRANATLKRSSTRRPRRVDGFKIGVSLILLAFALMAIRTYFTYIDSKVLAQVATPATKQTAIKEMQRKEGKLGTSHITSRPVAVEVPVHSFNPRMGRAGAPIQVILFTNPTCGECRDTLEVLARQTRQHISQMSLVVKTIPKPSGYNFQDVALNQAIEAGLFATLAAEKGQYWNFAKAVQDFKRTSPEVLTSTTYVDILSKLGIPLRDVRQMLAQNNERYLRQMEQDMDVLKSLGTKELPTVVVNGAIIEPLYGQTMADQATRAAEAFLR